KLGNCVRVDAGGLVALAVPAKIRRDDAEVRRERRELMAPAIPGLGEAVQEDDERSAAVDGTVEPDAVRVDHAMLDRHRARASGPVVALSMRRRVRYGARMTFEFV